MDNSGIVVEAETGKDRCFVTLSTGPLSLLSLAEITKTENSSLKDRRNTQKAYQPGAMEANHF
jgi:hypothetical protein